MNLIILDLFVLIFLQICIVSSLPAENYEKAKKSAPVPFMVVIGDDDSLSCVGALVESRYVLTSAVCVVRADGAEPLRVTSDGYLRDKASRHDGVRHAQGVALPVEFVRDAHESGLHDIAVVELDSSFPKHYQIRPITMAVGSHEYEKPATPCQIARTRYKYVLNKRQSRETPNANDSKQTKENKTISSVKSANASNPMDFIKPGKKSLPNADLQTLKFLLQSYHDTNTTTEAAMDAVEPHTTSGKSLNDTLSKNELESILVGENETHLEIFQIVNVTITPPEVCRFELRKMSDRWKELMKEGICTDGGFCKDDYGGPLVCNGKLSGIMSRCGENCSRPYLYQSLFHWKTFLRCALTERMCDRGDCKNVCTELPANYTFSHFINKKHAIFDELPHVGIANTSDESDVKSFYDDDQYYEEMSTSKEIQSNFTKGELNGMRTSDNITMDTEYVEEEYFIDDDGTEINNTMPFDVMNIRISTVKEYTRRKTSLNKHTPGQSNANPTKKKSKKKGTHRNISKKAKKERIKGQKQKFKNESMYSHPFNLNRRTTSAYKKYKHTIKKIETRGKSPNTHTNVTAKSCTAYGPMFLNTHPNSFKLVQLTIVKLLIIVTYS